MQKIKLLAPAIIAGQFLTTGTEVTVKDQNVVDEGYKAAKKQALRNQITKKAGDAESLLGTTADAVAYAVDDISMDILAVAGSANSSYKEKRIELYNELHGDNAWDKAVVGAQNWFDNRKSGVVKLPIDVKGLASVMADVAAKGATVANILEQAASS